MTKQEEIVFRCGKRMEVKENLIDGVMHKTYRIWAFGKNYYYVFVGGRCVSVCNV